MSLFFSEDGNFVVRSSDDVTFRVQRERLEQGSEIFRDMFSLCDTSQDQELVLPEPSPVLSVLLRLLHDPPPDNPLLQGAVPLPLLPALFKLVDKYALSEELHEILATHLLAHAPRQPLQVYSLAIKLGLDKIASDTTAYLLSKPMHEYTSEEVALIPTVQSYHELVVLHAERTKRLRDILLKEELFPKDYELCTTHGESTREIWARKANYVWGQIRAGTDVAEDMSPILKADIVKSCDKCRMGCVRSIEMIRYKCARLPKTTGRLQQEKRGEDSDGE